MEKIYLVYDEYRYDGADQGANAIPCATMEIAIKVLKQRYEWYLRNSYFQIFVGQCEDGSLYLKEDLLGKHDMWEVDEDSVEIIICNKDTRLDLHIAEESVVCE